jgi:hypothetical protein
MTYPRRPVIIIILAGLFLGIAGAVIYVKKTNDENKYKQSEPQQTNTSAVQQKFLTWDDPAGFTFRYPDDLAVDKHDEDTENYAHVELTHPAHPGNIIVWAKDTTAGTVDAWLTANREFSAGSSIDTTLGGNPAKKILLESPKRIIVAALDADVVVTVEALLSDPYWSSVTDSLVEAFAFVPLPAEEESPAGAEAGGAGTYDEEEVLE